MNHWSLVLFAVKRSLFALWNKDEDKYNQYRNLALRISAKRWGTPGVNGFSKKDTEAWTNAMVREAYERYHDTILKMYFSTPEFKNVATA